MQDNSANNKRIAKNTIFLYFRMMLIMAIGLYTSRVVLDKLGVEDYGIYNVIGGLVIIFSFINGAMITSTQRFLNYSIGVNDEEELRRVFNASQIIHFGIAALLIVVAETVGLWFLFYKMSIPPERMNAAFWTFQLTIATTAFLIFSYPYNALIIAHEKMNVFAYVSIIEAVLKLSVVFLLSMFDYDRLIFYAFLIMLVQIFVTLMYRLYSAKHYKETRFMVRDIPKQLYRRMVTFSGWNLLGNIAHVCLNQGTNIILNIFFGPVVNAAKGISMQVEHAVNQLCSNFQTAQNPQIVKSYAAKDYNYMHNLIFTSSRMSYYLTLILAVPIIFKVDFILSQWLKNVPNMTGSFVQYAMVCCIIQSLGRPLLTGCIATGNVKKLMSILAVFFWSVILWAYLALKMGGEPIVVFQILVAMYIIAHFIRIKIASEQLGFSVMLYVRQVLLPIVCVTVVVMLLTYGMNFISYSTIAGDTVLLLADCFLVVLVCWFLGLTKPEKHSIVRFVNKKLHKEG